MLFIHCAVVQLHLHAETFLRLPVNHLHLRVTVDFYPASCLLMMRVFRCGQGLLVLTGSACRPSYITTKVQTVFIQLGRAKTLVHVNNNYHLHFLKISASMKSSSSSSLPPRCLEPGLLPTPIFKLSRLGVARKLDPPASSTSVPPCHLGPIS